ncbi:unnamed protein product [Camellia sinensis]
MSFDEDNKQWICGKAGTVSLHRVSCIVRDIGEPCLHQSPIKVVIALTLEIQETFWSHDRLSRRGCMAPPRISKMLKPDKWQATFDSDGKVFGFQKALKSIILGEMNDGRYRRLGLGRFE